MDNLRRYRLVVLTIFFGGCFLLMAFRLFELQVIHYRFYRDKVEEQRLRLISVAPPRGDIFDRNGELLAASIDSFSFFAIPREVISREATARYLNEKLGVSLVELQEKLSSRSSFIWLKRKVDRPLAEEVLKRGLKGIYALNEMKRTYPKGNLAASILGFVGIDNQGLSGVELFYDKYLHGQEGKLLTERDPAGREMVMAARKIVERPLPGMNINLTIDSNIQFFAEQALAQAVQQYSGISGLAVVMDVKTGELLAVASRPTFDPQSYAKSDPKSWKCGLVSTVYEPGSTFKLITVGAGLEEGVIDERTRLKFLSEILVGGRVIKNSHTITKFGSTFSVSEMLQESVNTGAAQIGLLMGASRFHDRIAAFGFGRYTNVGLPGESRGILREAKDWYASDVGTITFGQGIAVTPVQLCAAIGAVANAGVRLQPHIVAKIESLDGSFIKVFCPEMVASAISKKVAQTLTAMMEDVVKFGSGRRGKIVGFCVAGKTGTAQKALPGGLGYFKDRYIASYIGFAPATKPRLLVFVMVDEPQGVIWGETVAGPAFKQIMERSLRYLNVAPDGI